MKLKIVYSTLPSYKSAKIIAKEVLSNKLAACVNILPNINSFFIWNDKIEEIEEVILIAKTLKALETEKKIKELHPYEVPCIITLDSSSCNESFLNYLKAVTN